MWKYLVGFLTALSFVVFLWVQYVFEKEDCVKINTYYGHPSNIEAPTQIPLSYLCYFSSGFDKDTVSIALDGKEIYKNIISTEWLINAADTFEFSKEQMTIPSLQLKVNEKCFNVTLNMDYSYYIIDFCSMNNNLVVVAKKNEPTYL